jgi:hypothetical protein
VLFWRDIWINGFTVAEIAPLVVMQMPTRIRNRRGAAKALPKHGWVEDIQDTVTVGGVRAVHQALGYSKQSRQR